MIQLGMKCRDKVTGFEGVATGRAQYLTGCDQYVLVPQAHNGKLEQSQWFDEGRLEAIELAVREEDVAAPKRGGPNRDAPKV